jgi:hypothetical protein
MPLNPLPDPVLEPAPTASSPHDHEASGSTDTRSEAGADITDSITLVPADEESEERSAEENADQVPGSGSRSAMKPAMRYLSAPLSDGRVSLSRHSSRNVPVSV